MRLNSNTNTYRLENPYLLVFSHSAGHPPNLTLNPSSVLPSRHPTSPLPQVTRQRTRIPAARRIPRAP